MPNFIGVQLEKVVLYFETNGLAYKVIYNSQNENKNELFVTQISKIDGCYLIVASNFKIEV